MFVVGYQVLPSCRLSIDLLSLLHHFLFVLLQSCGNHGGLAAGNCKELFVVYDWKLPIMLVAMREMI